jgi:hypothetical protein
VDVNDNAAQHPLALVMVILFPEAMKKIHYGTEEHITLLSFINLTPNSFNTSETSPEWRVMHV